MLRILRDLCWLISWRAWQLLRALSGDDAYDRYREALITTRSDDAPLTRAEFFQQRIDQKWNRYLQLGR